MKLLNKFDDGALKLEFDEDTFHFSIRETGREVFDFNTLSSGYAAVLDIVVDIIMRMEKRTNKTFIVSTHSPFILNSLDNVIIYDLENHLLVENGLSDVPYDGIVEGYLGNIKSVNLIGIICFGHAGIATM